MTELVVAAVVAFLSLGAGSHGGPETNEANETKNASLSPDERATWMAIGERCQAPLIRIPSRDGSFEIYVESPAARAAVVAAAAMMNHQPFDAQRVQTAIRGGYRIWVNYTDTSSRTIRIDRVTIRSERQPELEAVSIREERLNLGIAPSHGIVEAVRFRFPEFEFHDLPRHDYSVVLHTNRGVQHYVVTPAHRSRLMPVCNEDRLSPKPQSR